jgi:hypothetical protein
VTEPTSVSVEVAHTCSTRASGRTQGTREERRPCDLLTEVQRGLAEPIEIKRLLRRGLLIGQAVDMARSPRRQVGVGTHVIADHVSSPPVTSISSLRYLPVAELLPNESSLRSRRALPGGQYVARPPDRSKVKPVVKLAAGERIQPAISATSSSVQQRRIGIREVM